jgi:hypothetical protein
MPTHFSVGVGLRAYPFFCRGRLYAYPLIFKIARTGRYKTCPYSAYPFFLGAGAPCPGFFMSAIAEKVFFFSAIAEEEELKHSV